MQNSHETVAVPQGVAAARFRPPAGASSARVLPLNGEWRFRLFPEAVTGVPADEPGQQWETISVPGHWQLAGAPESWPFGTPAYTNKNYPFPVDPPRVPTANPTGEYRRWIELPEDWPANGATLLRFEGVDSWFEVSLNGVSLATSHGSRLPTEIDLTRWLRPGRNLLAVRVTQWSAMSYLEDQDQWWLSGIFRDVTLEHRPVGGLDQVAVNADYDHETGLGSLRVDVESIFGSSSRTESIRVQIPELGIETAAGKLASLDVEPWSAESPRLYDVRVAAAGETLDLRVGFRRVDVQGGVLRVNGRAIKLRGVNRHEFDPARGRALSPERMLEDVVLMKQHNVNAVRTSHYPPHPHFLDLCDEYGLYVIDENDLETHGFIAVDWRRNPTDDPNWTEVLNDRVTRLVRRDAHHPSVVLWSLGNEAGSGCNVAHMARTVRDLDPTRLVHYEGDWSSEDVDVFSMMYAPMGLTEAIGRGVEPPLARAAADARRRAMPFLQCEYAHAMGNGPGGLSEYDRIFDAHPRIAGGFIWEWIDHGIERSDADGNRFFAYGGDFGEALHDGTFVADGLLGPDREPTPSLKDVAAVFAPVRVEAAPGQGVVVHNRMAFRDLTGFAFEWTLQHAGAILERGVVEGIQAQPGERVHVELPTGLRLPEADESRTIWTLTVVQRPESAQERAWLGDGLVISQGQLVLQERVSFPPATGSAAGGDSGFRAGGANFDGQGRLVELFGHKVRHMGADFWRAPTDNDRKPADHGLVVADAEVWSTSGLHLIEERRENVGLVDGALVIETRAAGPVVDCGMRVMYSWRPIAGEADEVELTVSFEPDGRWLGSVARIGICLALEIDDVEDISVDWEGLGPMESYPDAQVAATLGRYRHTVHDLQTRYTHPQENGARQAVTFARLGLPEAPLRFAPGVVKYAEEVRNGLTMTIRPWSHQALAVAAHPTDLAPDGLLWLNFDVANHGLGTAACGPGVLPEHHLNPAPATLSLRISRA